MGVFLHTWFIWCWGLNPGFQHARRALYQLSYFLSSLCSNAVFVVPGATELQPLVFNVGPLWLQVYTVDVKAFQFSGAHSVIYHQASQRIWGPAAVGQVFHRYQ